MARLNRPSPAAVRRLRWAVPAVVGATIAAAALIPQAAAGSEQPRLPARTAAQLLVDVRGALPAGLSGTIVQTARLGLPSLPATGRGGTGLDLQSLATGSHTARVWYAGRDRQRVALLGELSETDVVRDGRDVWTYSSDQNAATHLRLPGRDAAGTAAIPVPGSPRQVAEQALATVDPTTAVSVDRTARVAGRPAYQLVLTPRDGRTLVASVRIARDSATSVPLRVQVYTRGQSAPGVEVGFTDISFRVPAPSVFHFTPPAGARVTERAVTADGVTGGSDAVRPTVIGHGWTAVLETRTRLA
ncbi:MAG TPA: sigma-E factor regulatory protein RseB domain-containing protein, partial [Frankiaceae bacterium]|nr:sigma-E factor regulatory protein RseB domain-containing protein [Frankiaceae bacterium]